MFSINQGHDGLPTGDFGKPPAFMAETTPQGPLSQDHENSILNSWLNEADYSVIEDYDPQEDEIVLVYDAQRHPSPRLSLDHSQGPDWVRVLIDDHEIAKVNMPLTLEQINLLPI